jgi:hypothetical protein
MPFYEYEYIVQNLIDILKEKQEAEEKQGKDQNMDAGKYMKGMNKYMPSGMNSSNPSIPKMSGLSNFPGIPSSLKI